MPKLSNARRHRKQLNLLACWNGGVLESAGLSAPRKVSEEDIQEKGNEGEAQECAPLDKEPPSPQPVKPQLKRPKPSMCLSSQAQTPLIPTEEKCSPDQFGSPAAPCTETQEEADRDEISPIWGHFIDVILDSESMSAPVSTNSGTSPKNRSSSFLPPTCTLPSPDRLTPSHEPYTKRRRIRSPHRLNMSKKRQQEEGEGKSSPTNDEDDEFFLDGFFLQDPSKLGDALSRLKVE